MAWIRLFSLTILLLVSLIQCSVLKPNVLPLLVRNPYLQAHLRNAREPPYRSWPIFWTGPNQELGLSFMAYVPHSQTIYPLLGRPQDELDQDDEDYQIILPLYLGAQYDASTTNFTYQIPHGASDPDAKPINLTLSFLSPITPCCLLRQSVPFGYVQVVAEGDFPVHVYADIRGNGWISGDTNAEMEWERYDSLNNVSSVPLHSYRIRRKHEMEFSEIRNKAEWGSLYFTTTSESNHITYTPSSLRRVFAQRSNLQSKSDEENYLSSSLEPIFAFQVELLSSGREISHSEVDSALFTIGFVREKLVQFASSDGLKDMKPYWKSSFHTVDELIQWHYNDFEKAKNLADEYSTRLRKDAQDLGGDDYADILALSARQVLGATDFSGTPENPYIFLKEISSNGNTQTIDVTFPSFPFFVYTNPKWLTYLLEPLMEHMLSGQYPNKYAMHDLGRHYPNLTGHPDGNDEYMPVEECGDIIIMGLVMVQALMGEDALLDCRSSTPMKSGLPLLIHNMQSPLNIWKSTAASSVSDSNSRSRALETPLAWLHRTHKLWTQWTQYLINYSLKPENQLSTDDFAGWLPLQSNLALKGIIGIKAMSEIEKLLGNCKDAKYYMNISNEYVKKWQKFAISRDGGHVKLAYDWYGSWTTLYSLFADSVLCFHTDSEGVSSVFSNDSGRTGSKNFIPHWLYATQSLFYISALQKYGLPLDSRHLYTKSDWAFSAAAVSSPSVRKQIIERTAKWVNETKIDEPFSDWYDTEGEGWFGGGRFAARPVVGSHWGILVLEDACGGRARTGLREWFWKQEEKLLARGDWDDDDDDGNAKDEL